MSKVPSATDLREIFYAELSDAVQNALARTMHEDIDDVDHMRIGEEIPHDGRPADVIDPEGNEWRIKVVVTRHRMKS